MNLATARWGPHTGYARCCASNQSAEPDGCFVSSSLAYDINPAGASCPRTYLKKRRKPA
jgi:hypothetical protein